MSDIPQPTAVAADRELEAVAKAFAKTLGSNVAARQLLKTEALKKFDGDFDVLYRAFTAQKPEFGQAIDKLVKADGNEGMTSVLEHTPNLNISVPVNIDKWDDATYAPLVLFIPAGFDEKSNTQPFKAYDKDGQVHLLDAKHAPNFPVVVVGPSERVFGTSMTSEYYSKKGDRSTFDKKAPVTNRLLPED